MQTGEERGVMLGIPRPIKRKGGKKQPVGKLGNNQKFDLPPMLMPPVM